MVEELQVYGGPHALGDRVVGGQPGLLPSDGEVHRQRDAELLIVHLEGEQHSLVLLSALMTSLAGLLSRMTALLCTQKRQTL